MAAIKVDEVIRQLEEYREIYGEEEYRRSARGLAAQLVRTEAGRKVVEEHFPFLDVDELKASQDSPQPQMTSDQAMMEALKQRIPSLRTQAQFNLFSTAFDVLTSYLEFSFRGDADGAKRLREGLNTVLDKAATVTEIGNKLQEDSEAVDSPEAREFKEPPRELHEFDLQKQLMTELGNLASMTDLQEWYSRSQEDFNRIVNQSLRNELFDTIRSRKGELGSVLS